MQTLDHGGLEAAVPYGMDACFDVTLEDCVVIGASVSLNRHHEILDSETTYDKVLYRNSKGVLVDVSDLIPDEDVQAYINRVADERMAYERCVPESGTISYVVLERWA